MKKLLIALTIMLFSTTGYSICGAIDGFNGAIKDIEGQEVGRVNNSHTVIINDIKQGSVYTRIVLTNADSTGRQSGLMIFIVGGNHINALCVVPGEDEPNKLFIEPIAIADGFESVRFFKPIELSRVNFTGVRVVRITDEYVYDEEATLGDEIEISDEAE